MSYLDPTDIQGFALRGYNFPVARFLFLRFPDAKRGREFLSWTLGKITHGGHWPKDEKQCIRKPAVTHNIAFTYAGLAALGVPPASLQGFPVEFIQGMRARHKILGDIGKNAPEHWEPLWQGQPVHTWLATYAQEQQALADTQAAIEAHGAEIIGSQDAAKLVIDGARSEKEHFGFTDGFGNPDYLGMERHTQPGQGKIAPGNGWAPLATGELLLGYADEAGEWPVAPLPHLLANNGTFLVYRKLHQNVASFRAYMKERGRLYPGGEEKLLAKFVGRWPDGTPLELSPEREDPAIVKDDNRNVDFTYGKDLEGTRCPLSAHIRRTNPRDAFGFEGRLVNRRASVSRVRILGVPLNCSDRFCRSDPTSRDRQNLYLPQAHCRLRVRYPVRSSQRCK